ncbi:esterase [Streptomyces lincolnensis]|uniref:Esterase n=1 Tax=Streptomyces lincolnensis TaxID=1915 RepID=A0A1B1MFH5_STRLN|nr:serine hydrolase domain-containing protein [Streptomyces lincolnensis]ANS67321.1 esterase [Streptomyces lincolnensis]AXG56192.1 esterase [Streptomyces lincolnensis]QMV07345.1 serine hydrolase [Streptomyces lincolnensis]
MTTLPDTTAPALPGTDPAGASVTDPAGSTVPDVRLAGRGEHGLVAEGYVAEGFEEVREEFDRNLRERDELGGAFCAWWRGAKVVDIWGGVADSAAARPWEPGTKSLIFSGSKGIVAITLLVAVQRGLVDFDTPVAHYWPEFARHGKDRITLRQVMSYTAGLPGVRVPLGQDDITDPLAMAALIAEQAPEDDERAGGILYGPYTAGWIAGEVIRRASGRPVDRFFAEEIAAPHGLDMSYGISADRQGEVAQLQYGAHFLDQYTGFFTSDDPMTRRIWQNPIPFPHEEMVWNRPERRTGLIPAANVIGTARAISRLYSILATDATRAPGEEFTLLSREVLDDARREYVRKTDPLIDIRMVYGGAGFRLRSTPREGVDGDSFGHDGGGGSAHLAWPGAGVGVSYITNRLIAVGPDDKRASSLLKALARSVSRLGA